MASTPTTRFVSASMWIVGGIVAFMLLQGRFNLEQEKKIRTVFFFLIALLVVTNILPPQR